MLDSTTRSREHLKAQGWFTAKVEQREFGGRTADLWGFADMVALHAEHGHLWVQCCGSDFTAHVKKYAANEQLTRRILRVAKTPMTRVLIFSWRKQLVKRGGSAYRYVLHCFEAVPDSKGGVEWKKVPA